jgi:hypothetical protein
MGQNTKPIHSFVLACTFITSIFRLRTKGHTSALGQFHLAHMRPHRFFLVPQLHVHQIQPQSFAGVWVGKPLTFSQTNTSPRQQCHMGAILGCILLFQIGCVAPNGGGHPSGPPRPKPPPIRPQDGSTAPIRPAAPTAPSGGNYTPTNPFSQHPSP